MMRFPILLLTYLQLVLCVVLSTEREGQRTFEQYRRNPQPVHLSNSFPTVASKLLDITKQCEHALSNMDSSRTEIKGSRRTRREPPGTDWVVSRPLPEESFVTIATFELLSLEAVEEVIEGDI